MSVSLKNKKNTKIIENHLSATLIHHGNTTCNFDKVNRIVTICLCGWDTVTTRGKINAFIQRYTNKHISVYRKRGETWINNEGEHFALESCYKPVELYID